MNWIPWGEAAVTDKAIAAGEAAASYSVRRNKTKHKKQKSEAKNK